MEANSDQYLAAVAYLLGEQNPDGGPGAKPRKLWHFRRFRGCNGSKLCSISGSGLPLWGANPPWGPGAKPRKFWHFMLFRGLNGCKLWSILGNHITEQLPSKEYISSKVNNYLDRPISWLSYCKPCKGNCMCYIVMVRSSSWSNHIPTILVKVSPHKTFLAVVINHIVILDPCTTWS